MILYGPDGKLIKPFMPPDLAAVLIREAESINQYSEAFQRVSSLVDANGKSLESSIPPIGATVRMKVPERWRDP